MSRPPDNGTGRGRERPAVMELGLLFANFVGAALMTAVIWFVQLVQYPMLSCVSAEGFAEYAEEYQRRVGWVVIGPMLLEVATAAALAVWFPGVFRSPLFAIATALLVIVWLSTFFWQVAIHRRLRAGFDAKTIALLVRSNWLRTAAWTARAALVGIELGRRVDGGP